LIYKDSLDINKNEFKGISIRLKDIVKDENPNGLYLVRLPEDVEYNGRINKPILFGVVNSHITMKVGRN
jgi:hypothetical protein